MFSIWHWLVVIAIVVLMAAAMVVRRWPRHGFAYADAGIHVHTATQYICASLHTGRIDPQGVLDRWRDRHKAKLPELGLNTTRIRSEAKKAKQRKAMFSITSLAVPLWVIALLYDRFPSMESLEDAERWAMLLPTLLPELMMPLLLMTLIGFVEVIITNAYLRRCIVPLVEGPDHDEKQNVVVFGGFSPFAGYGIDLDGWSFTTDASRPPDSGKGQPQPFTQIELLDQVSRTLEKNVIFGDACDRLFVSGRRIRNQKMFLHDFKAIPNTAVGAKTMTSRIGKPEDQDGRHYRVFSTSFAGGHMFLTSFFRSTMLGNNLFIECRRFLLMPIRPEFTELNELPVKQGFVYLFEELLRQLLAAPFAWVRGPVFLLGALKRLWSRIVRTVFGDPEDRLKARQETYNYGHSTSLRENWSSTFYHTYFQVIDQDKIGKICDYIIMNAIADFLESKDISTADLRQRSTQIFNSGVMVSGGIINTHQMAVGKNATAKAGVFNDLSSSKR